MRRLTIPQFHAELKAQGVDQLNTAFKCPACGTVQSARDLIAAGAGKTFEEVEPDVGFACVGRWTHAGPPRGKPDGRPCNWTLGGLLRIHSLEVLDAQGKPHPFMEPASPADAQAHANTRIQP